MQNFQTETTVDYKYFILVYNLTRLSFEYSAKFIYVKLNII